MDFFEFIGNFKTHEMERRVREERKPQKEKCVAFNVTSSIPVDDENVGEDEEVEFAMLVRKMGRMFYKQGKMINHRRPKWQGKGERKKEEVGPYCNCKKLGHLITDCLNLKATTSRRMSKKKAMMAS